MAVEVKRAIVENIVDDVESLFNTLLLKLQNPLDRIQGISMYLYSLHSH